MRGRTAILYRIDREDFLGRFTLEQRYEDEWASQKVSRCEMSWTEELAKSVGKKNM